MCLGLSEHERGRTISGRTLVPGILGYAEYLKRRATWDKVRQSVGLDGEFYEGAELMLFPRAWLEGAQRLKREGERKAVALGVDAGEGVANTAMAVVDDLGLLSLRSHKTSNTAVITGEVIALGREYGIPPDCWLFDRGGGGKQHADRLRSQGYNVRTIAFGESVQDELRRGFIPIRIRKATQEARYVYRNRRAELYGDLSLLLDPDYNEDGFSLIPEAAGPQYAEVIRQLSMIPKRYDEEGRLFMMPKNRSPRDEFDPQSKPGTLVNLLGCSPDEADALVLAVHGLKKQWRPVVGVIPT